MRDHRIMQASGGSMASKTTGTGNEVPPFVGTFVDARLPTK